LRDASRHFRPACPPDGWTPVIDQTTHDSKDAPSRRAPEAICSHPALHLRAFGGLQWHGAVMVTGAEAFGQLTMPLHFTRFPSGRSFEFNGDSDSDGRESQRKHSQAQRKRKLQPLIVSHARGGEHRQERAHRGAD
jgi:hypothetical protein